MRHRTDIDGLRALAVLPIVAFHAGLTWLRGGFVGVDIFFVISGFLITTIIQREMAAGHFSLVGFYHRRVARILPALFAMLTVVVLAGTRLLLDDELRGLARSAAAAAAFVANIYFYQDADYFAGAAEGKPLLHTWSLGVEEQFYLFFPVLLLLVHRVAASRLRQALLVLTVLSFAASLLMGRSGQAAAFYLIPSRAWELGLGALVAVGALSFLATRSRRQFAAMAGLVLIMAGYALIDDGKAFPAPWALLPCIGTALLLGCGETGWTAGLLSIAPFRWIGRISYSLYLWHWPVITFWRLNTGMHLDAIEGVALVAVSLGLAALSYRFVEQPFLGRYRDAPAGYVLSVGTGALALVVGGATLAAARSATIVPVSSDVMRVERYSAYRDLPAYGYQFRRGHCFIGEGQRFDKARCLKPQAGMRNVVVLGDSHAAQHWRALALQFPTVNVMQATASGCRPVLPLRGERRCTALVAQVFAMYPRDGLDAVVLGGRWTDGDAPALARAVRLLRLHGLQVTVIGPTVEYDGEFPLLLARAMLRHDTALLRGTLVPGRFDLDNRLRQLVTSAGGRYFSQVARECPAGTCRLVTARGVPYHFDYGHMTLTASEEMMAEMPPI